MDCQLAPKLCSQKSLIETKLRVVDPIGKGSFAGAFKYTLRREAWKHRYGSQPKCPDVKYDIMVLRRRDYGARPTFIQLLGKIKQHEDQFELKASDGNLELSASEAGVQQPVILPLQLSNADTPIDDGTVIDEAGNIVTEL